ncbi:MBL fold hydrolase [Anaerocolumna cellulosilytica]|uniref:MBL fold hydrolase n=1 Tax=Anaerocolumna cellulosilytica TaxID=433286 RepID=A0A6S6R3J3_9FIRM|nr:MBL fold metallo-hydrolase [Anaerocolumna cellulosilytica]MBB5195397.1 7,8-dihydropterin-6-yl-methyl-4-(beta-D-ribofuranosyl)aminobenzene 5'-phosphate synthase [Anaerocolumna cellulosilytica]BCJ95929.1 MBL fold hydrolase [Anaerocolumna cellulosilytica]
MRITVLTDNHTYIDKYYLGEPAVSYYIEIDGIKILFDTGYSDVFLRNGRDMGIDFTALDYVVISHGHNDHTGGIPLLLQELDRNSAKRALIAHPDIFAERYAEGINISPKVAVEEVQQYFTLKLTQEPIQLTPHLYFLGAVPRRNDFEAKDAVGIRRTQVGDVEDFVVDDSALVYKGEKGIYIITGCSHAGICNITEYAKEVTEEEQVLGILGGFHLFEMNQQAEKTIEYLKQLKIPSLYPCHCTSLRLKAEMMKNMQVEEAGVGLVLEWV